MCHVPVCERRVATESVLPSRNVFPPFCLWGVGEYFPLLPPSYSHLKCSIIPCTRHPHLHYPCAVYVGTVRLGSIGALGYVNLDPPTSRVRFVPTDEECISGIQDTTSSTTTGTLYKYQYR